MLRAVLQRSLNFGLPVIWSDWGPCVCQRRLLRAQFAEQTDPSTGNQLGVLAGRCLPTILDAFAVKKKNTRRLASPRKQLEVR